MSEKNYLLVTYVYIYIPTALLTILYSIIIFKQAFLQPGVLTTRGLTTRGSYIQRFLQPGVLQPGVLISRGLTTRGSYNQAKAKGLKLKMKTPHKNFVEYSHPTACSSVDREPTWYY